MELTENKQDVDKCKNVKKFIKVFGKSVSFVRNGGSNR